MPASTAGAQRMHGSTAWKSLGWMVTACLSCALCLPVFAAEPMYRVEVLVFRNEGSAANPVTVERLRDFATLYQLDEPQAPTVPQALTSTGQIFANLRSRLSRLGAYEPLVLVAWDQSQLEFQPAVRVHDEQVIDQRLHLPAEVFWMDLAGQPLFSANTVPLYRLDGSVRLRRSRYLHVDLDLEYRVEDPATASVFGFSPVDMVPLNAPAEPGSGATAPAPERFQVHHLRQSRQVKLGEVHYFDTAWLGALVRVSLVADS
jgi:hypothetical protein